jgi:hemerythrin
MAIGTNAGGGNPPVRERQTVIRDVRPLIGRLHLLGHEVIDADHLAIADWWFRTVNCEPIQFEFFVARLKKLMQRHFDHEAMLMEEAGGRMCRCHNQEHEMLLALCDRARALGRSHWPRARSLLRTHLPRLVREHIICMDQLTVLFINSQEKIAGVC